MSHDLAKSFVPHGAEGNVERILRSVVDGFYIKNKQINSFGRTMLYKVILF